MIQYSETYRVKLSLSTREKLSILKAKYQICPTKFIRLSIEEKLIRDVPKLKTKKIKTFLPF
jgi:hypothetical protein